MCLCLGLKVGFETTTPKAVVNLFHSFIHIEMEVEKMDIGKP
jgi:hypothetical protein